MKFSFMSFSCPELSLGEMLAAAKRFGYDGIEPRILCKHKHGVEMDASPAQRKEIKKQAVDSGIAIACVATSCVYSDPETVKRNIDDTLKCIDLAADISAPCIRVFGGRLAKGLSREDAITLVAESFGSVAGHAKERGVTVCHETHDDWCDPAHVAEVVRRVNHPNIAVNWDIMHPVRVAHVTMDQAFTALKPWIRHLHVHDGVTKDDKLVLAPIGTGEIDHKRALKLLQTIDYQGFISGEWSGIGWSDKHEVHLPRELATMKTYL